MAHPLSADDFWTVVLGSGYRVAVDAIGPDAADRVRTALRLRMEQEHVEELIVDVMYARARKD